ncbi:MAG: radical SAM protein [Candidatus Omnitrophica bacterium]|nr:radical SAM protein [Candidatus Omnitrophota bacterium]
MDINNKQINKVKLTVTTQCNLYCDYCFVNKTNSVMNFQTAKYAIGALLKSKGRDKLLSLYGGEPLLNFELIKKICPYATNLAKKFNKKLDISICTNGTLLTKKHLSFFRDFNVKLIISLVGKDIYHDRFRKFKFNKNTYKTIYGNLQLVFKVIPRENLGVSFCIFPSLIDKIEENFSHLVDLGFTYINFEIIREYQHWTSDITDKFSLTLGRILNFIIKNIPQKRFIYLNPINWEIKHSIISRYLKGDCLFAYSLEVYPKGELAFSPFLLNAIGKKKYIIGNIGLSLSRFKDCKFHPNSELCKECESLYHRGYKTDRFANDAYSIYRNLCLKAANTIVSHRKEKYFQEYIDQIKRKVCF